jgi:1-deoxy-D-xylulose-5-phosphate reductoisomerase
MKKKISILGSTGSIGLNALSIIDKKRHLFNIILLSSNKNYKLICKQIKNYKPEYYVIKDFKTFKKVKKKFKKSETKIFNFFKFENKKFKSEITISAIPGIAGLEPTINIIKHTKKILIANKEAIICGWSLLKRTATKHKTKIIPVDSEHFSISQLIKDVKINDIEKIYLTASGGPFLNLKISQFKNINPKQALIHPKWKMGKKISIDSSTLINKLLELIEAQKLFNIPGHKLDILIHPNSLVHAIVKFKNGLTKFLYHETSMVIPLANAIFDGKLNIKYFLKNKKNLNSKYFQNLIFKRPNKKIFPIIKIVKRINEYPSTPIIINSANEVLVEQFLQKNIPFTYISKIIKTIMNDRNYRKYAIKKCKNINQINSIDYWARETTYKKLKIQK